jgi:hypothetical protein
MPTDPKRGTLAYTLATWIYLLHATGRVCADPALRQACTDLGTGIDLESLGGALVEQIQGRLKGETAQDAQVLAAELFGTAAVLSGLGENREQALRQARRYQFHTGLPWLACVVDRFPDGHVGPHWVLVESLEERVRCLDPYPWDDLDEEFEQPLVEFLVKWELGGLAGLRYA